MPVSVKDINYSMINKNFASSLALHSGTPRLVDQEAHTSLLHIASLCICFKFFEERAVGCVLFCSITVQRVLVRNPSTGLLIWLQISQPLASPTSRNCREIYGRNRITICDDSGPGINI